MNPTPLVVRPLQWSALPDLMEAGPLDAADNACLADVAAVLARHGKLDRFAIHLVHKHFEVGPDEVLIEFPDAESRQLVTVVASRDDAADAIPTTWLLTGEDSGGVFCACASNPYFGGHTGGHVVIKGPKERPEPERDGGRE